MLNKHLYIFGKSICLYNYCILSINLLINKYNERLLPLPGQFILIPNTSKSEIIWNANLMQKGDFINVFLARHISGTYAHHHEHLMLSWSVRCCAHDLTCSSLDYHISKNSVQKTICCNSTSNTPDDERIYPKHVELRIH
jgi:hypothetical protein